MQFTDEHKALASNVKNFAQNEIKPFVEDWEKNGHFPAHDLFKKMGNLDFLGITKSTEYGGLGLDYSYGMVFAEALGYAADLGVITAIGVQTDMATPALDRFGSEELKKEFLTPSILGDLVSAIAVSEPGAGSDVASIKTTAQKTGDDYVINGQKMWITNGCIDEDGTPADVVWVYARTGEDERGRVQMSTFLVEAGMPGYSVGQKIYDKTGMRASNTAELVFDDCIVPAGNLVGGVGESLIHMMGNLELERLTLAAMALGIGRRALDEMNRYATDRTAFGSPIPDFGQIQRYIGESWAKYRAMRAYIYDTANNLTIGSAGQRLDSDGVKLFATTAAKEIADAAMQVMGGYGYVGEYHVERLWRDAKLLEIGGGTLESHQKNITRDLFKDGDAVNR